MNTMTRAYQHQITSSPLWAVLSHKQLLAFATLALSVFLTAVGVVYMKDLNRRLFIQYQDMQQTQQQYNVAWGKLLLEQSAWSTQARVQYVAKNKLHMVVPSSQNTKLLTLRS